MSKYALIKEEDGELYLASKKLITKEENILFESDSVSEVVNEWEKYRQQ